MLHLFSHSFGLGKHKIFFWLLLRDRLNTRNLLRRKNKILEDYSCVLCTTNCEETSFHLFFYCPFSRSCLNFISVNCNLHLPPMDMVIKARNDFDNSVFREVVVTACWIIWTTRNRVVVFDGLNFTLSRWIEDFKKELGLVCIKAKQSVKLSLELWLENIP